MAALLTGILGLACLLPGCGASGGTGSGATTGTSPAARDAPIIELGSEQYQPRLDPADFVDGVDNPYFPLVPATRWVYAGVVDGVSERIELEVTDERKTILGISAVGVRDVNYHDGELAARTMDYYAQDRVGNVWYLGEVTQNYENGMPTDLEGWESGVGGALPGIFMLAEPAVGDAYRQVHHAGQAEDLAEVIGMGATRSIALGDYRDVLVILGWSPLEPDIIEEKYYAPGVGKVYEVLTAGGEGGTELVEHSAPG
ncbi:MAG: hypothetical protein ACR2J5_14550 [Geodermatophilaceae bacterium]